MSTCVPLTFSFLIGLLIQLIWTVVPAAIFYMLLNILFSVIVSVFMYEMSVLITQ